MKPPLTLFQLAACAALLAQPFRASGAPVDPPAGEELDEYAAPRVSDPFEPVNRAIFKFNDGFYVHLVRPLARGYERTVPAPVRRGIGNFFDNLRFPVRLVGSVLQGKPRQATRETGKFLLNSTAGLAGLVRVSDSFPALTAVPAEDVGQTLGTWGFGAGPYLVLPLLGPCSVRDTIGLAGDSTLNITNWSQAEQAFKGYDYTWRIGAHTLEFTNLSPELIRAYESLTRPALDPYIAVRNGYLQYRAAAVKK